MSRLASWVPPLAWMAVILWFSSAAWSAETTGGTLIPLLRWLLPWATPVDLALMHAVTRKAAHLVEYAILATLWHRALARETSFRPAAATATAFAVSVAWAMVDEAHQATIASRTGSAVDVAIDAAGAAAALAALTTSWRRAADAATSALLWTAAVGGAVALALNWLANVESRALWLSTPVAAAMIVLRRRGRATAKHDHA